MLKYKEFVAELSQEKLSKYVMRATDDHGHQAFMARVSNDPDHKAGAMKRREKRRKGIARAVDKMVVKTSVQGWSKK